jgi:hypothetical protein
MLARPSSNVASTTGQKCLAVCPEVMRLALRRIAHATVPSLQLFLRSCLTMVSWSSRRYREATRDCLLGSQALTGQLDLPTDSSYSTALANTLIMLHDCAEPAACRKPCVQLFE